MKTQLLLMFLFSFILCSKPFLRQLEDTVTEASCKSEGKKYQEAVASQCKIADLIIEGKEEKDCTKGKWTEGTAHCSAKEIQTDTDCKGTPKFTASTEKIKTCKLGDVVVKDTADKKYSESQESCQQELVWTEETCTFTVTGKTEEECKSLNGKWTKTESGESRIRRTESDTGTCVYNEKKSSTECSGAKGEYHEASCSIPQFDSSATCKGSTSYSEETKYVCKSGSIELGSRTTQKDCEEELVWTTGTCSYEKIYTQKDCESEPSFTAAVPAKCVAGESSNSNFIKAINFALLAICLLIL